MAPYSGLIKRNKHNNLSNELMNSKQPKKQVKVTGFFLLVQPVVVVALGAMRVRERAA